ncbi:MAG: M50 family metallopeptidase, partial [Anaerolineales bacterium]
MKGIAKLAGYILLAAVIALLGLAIHEAGHAVTAVLCGGQVTKIQLLTLQIWPAIRWV